MKRHMKHPRMDVNLDELDQIIDRGTHAPLSESEGEKLKRVLHALAGMLPAPRITEKTKNVLEQPEAPAPEDAAEPPLLIKRRDTGAMELRPTPARRKLPFHIRNYTRVTLAQVA
jgi:hypothetical protein